MRLSQPLLLTLCFASSTAGLAAQTPPRAQEPPPQFRTEVAAVVVDVLVLDSEGRPAPGLRQEDFEVYEDGARQTIESFDVIDWSSYLRRDLPRPGQAPVPPADQVNAFPRRFVFVINRQSAKFGFLVRARKALETFVTESMAEGDEAMVVDIGLSTRVLQEFRDSKEETLRTVRKISGMEVEVNPGFPQGRTAWGLEERATRNVYDSLEALGEALRNFSGRKIVILMSPELNRTRDLITYLQDTVNALNRSNTTVYSIDIRGVETVSAEQSGLTGALLSQPFGDVAQVSSPDSFDFGGLFPLANETGGRYFYNLNVFEPAVTRIGEENRRYYVLSYVSTNTALDGKYRKIEVRAPSRPELKVVSRRGYFARKEKPAKEASKDKKKTAPAAAAPPSNRPAASPASGATAGDPAPAGPRPPEQVEVTTYFLPGAEGKLEVPVAVALPLDLLQPKEGESGSMTLTLRLKDAAGQIVDTQQESVDPARFYLIRPMKLSPGSYLLGILLEAAGKKVYEANEAIVVPAEMGKRFGISSIVPVLPTVTTGGPKDGLALRPTPTLKRGEDAYLYFRILPGEGTELSEEGTAIAFTIYKGEQEIRSITTKEPPKLSGDGKSGYPIMLRIPTADLSWGRHRIELSVTNSRLGRKATGEIELTFQ